VARWIERNTGLEVGTDLYLAYCPERIAEGMAHEELRTLPQIVGADDERSHEAAGAFWSRLAPEVLGCDYVTAELIKLFNNIARYVSFAVANQFAMVCDTFGANIFEARRLANHDYPRAYIASPGLTAGTCLRKDFGMISEWSPYPDMMLSAWKMNEYTPAFLVSHLLQRAPIHDRVIAILGYTFKRDTDDIRDSLVPKLYRYVLREMPFEIRVSDHHLPGTIEDPANGSLTNFEVRDALRGADSVFVAIDHTGYDRALRDLAGHSPSTWVVDLWNVGGIDSVFYQAGDLLTGGRESS
jgi:UDP-N-acetyl-D-mannosaminuronic acid dehydrogenase